MQASDKTLTNTEPTLQVHNFLTVALQENHAVSMLKYFYYIEECQSVFSNVMYRFIHIHREKKRSITIGKHLLRFHHSLLRRLNQIKQMINSGKVKGMNKFEAHLLWNMYIEEKSILYSYSFCTSVSMRQRSTESRQWESDQDIIVS